MNEPEQEEKEQRKKFEEEYLLSKRPIEYMERLKREFDMAMFKELQDINSLIIFLDCWMLSNPGIRRLIFTH